MDKKSARTDCATDCKILANWEIAEGKRLDDVCGSTPPSQRPNGAGNSIEVFKVVRIRDGSRF